MNKNKMNFKQIYIIFGLIFTFISLLFIIFAINKGLMLFIIYIVIVFIIAILFLLAIRKKIRGIIERMDNMVEKVVNHKNLKVKYDETIIGALENKLYNFLVTSNAVLNERENEKNKIKSLISDISHQTRTPISNILLYSQLLDEKNLPSDSKQFVYQIVTQSEKLSFLVQTLVKMSRLETGIINPNKKVSYIKSMMEEVINTVENKANFKNIKIDLSCKDTLQAVFDLKWTQEAIYNILDNAVKYTPNEGKITISVIRYEMFTKIDIADTGIGIEQSEVNDIFKRFYRSNEVSKKPGIGIGLYLSRKIITLQGGYIKVKSERGQGSIFSVFLRNKY